MIFDRFLNRQKNTYDMPKQKLTLSVDGNLIALARSKGVNLSKLMEQILLSNNSNDSPSRGFDSGSNPDGSTPQALKIKHACLCGALLSGIQIPSPTLKNILSETEALTRF